MSMKSSDFGEKVYDDGRTKQSFKDATDVNKIIKKHQLKVATSHLTTYPPEAYGEFEDYDLLEAHQKVTRAQKIFSALPSEVRNEFGNDALRFAGFASNPANNAELAKILPAIAEPGSYFPNPVARGGQGAAAATPPKEVLQEGGAQAPQVVTEPQNGVSPPVENK